MEKEQNTSLQPTPDQSAIKMFGQKNVILADGASIIAAANNSCKVSKFNSYAFQDYLFFVTRADFPYNKMFNKR